jgi:hypothetical protein
MNCKLVREKLTDALAVGGLELSSELTSHVRSCSGCRSFYEAEARLQRSIDESLGAIVNQPVPTSLLPRVRERLEVSAPRANWWPALIPITAVFVIAGLLIMTLFQQKHMPTTPTSASVQPNPHGQSNTMQLSADSARVITALPIVPRPPSAHISKSRQLAAPKQAAIPEILVSPDELQGMNLLASTVYRKPSVGKAILNPIAPPIPDTKPIATQEITPLEVASLEIRPLLIEDR